MFESFKSRNPHNFVYLGDGAVFCVEERGDGTFDVLDENDTEPCIWLNLVPGITPDDEIDEYKAEELDEALIAYIEAR